MVTVNRLEFLPNEILLECFRYFTALDLFHSFDQLNERFSQLWRSTPLHFEFSNNLNNNNQQFFDILHQNPSLKQQICSLHLSNQKSLRRIDSFLSQFSLEEFPSVKSLVLTHIKQTNADKLVLILPKMASLDCFSLIDVPNEISDILVVLLLTKLKRLSIPSFERDISNSEKPWRMRRLSILNVSLKQIFNIFDCAPQLKHLYIRSVDQENHYTTAWDEGHGVQSSALSLERLTIDNLSASFGSLERLLQQTPKLRSLILGSYRQSEAFDPDKWEQLIRSSLPHLIDFQFVFYCKRPRLSDETAILNQIKQYQGDFWQRDHHWFVRCQCFIGTIVVHTIPFPTSTYRLCSSVEHFSSNSVDQQSLFDRVIDLCVEYDMTQRSTPYYFANVEVLKFHRDFPKYYSLEPMERSFNHDLVQWLKRNVCLSNVTDVRFHCTYSFQTSSAIVDFLQQIPKLTSIMMNLEMFRSWVIDERVCLTLKSIIKKLVLSEITTDPLFTRDYSIDQFCSTFPHLEEFYGELNRPDELIALLHRLTKLAKIQVRFFQDTHDAAGQETVRKYISRFQRDFSLNNDEIEIYRYSRDRLYVYIHRTIFE